MARSGTNDAKGPGKRGKKDDEKDNSKSTSYRDTGGNMVTVIRCEQCKGNGCDACAGWGFFKQGVLL